MTAVETPSMLTVQVPGDEASPTVTVLASYNAALGRYAAASVFVEHPFAEVRSSVLRRTPVRRILAEGLRPQLLEANPALGRDRAVKAWAAGKNGRRPAAKQVASPDAAHLASAAAVLSLERTVGGFPVRAVERAFGIERADAARWVRLVRKEGLA